jgi:hypothetical protein
VNWKGFGRKRSLPNFKVPSRNMPGGTEINHEEASRQSVTQLFVKNVDEVHSIPGP